MALGKGRPLTVQVLSGEEGSFPEAQVRRHGVAWRAPCRTAAASDGAKPRMSGNRPVPNIARRLMGFTPPENSISRLPIATV